MREVRRTVGIVVQARMGSTRLPGKVLLPILGRPMLLRQLERLMRCRTPDRLIVATSTEPADDRIAEVVSGHGAATVYRGPETDVLRRYLEAAEAHDLDVIVRVTGDCPLIEPAVVDRCVKNFLSPDRESDYVSNIRIRTYARGLDTEVFPFRVLRVVDAEASEAFEREHVTPFVRAHPERFDLVDVTDVEDHSNLRLTVDTSEDFTLVRRIYEELYPDNSGFSYREVIALLAARPDLRRINMHVAQKPLPS